MRVGVLIFILILTPWPVFSADLLVPSDFRSIQEAIDAAEDGDRILVAAGTYTGRGFRGITFEGKNVTVEGSSAADCILDCEQLDRGFDFHRGEGNGSVVRNLQIVNGVDACAS